MNILMIGGTRFIGLEVARQLSKRGHGVTLFHRTHSDGLPFTQFLGNRDNVHDLQTCIEQVAPDCIVHMCAMEESHIFTLERALCGHKARVVVISSADVYKAFEVIWRRSNEPVQATPLNENSTLRDIRFPFRGADKSSDNYNYEKINVETAALNSPYMDAVIVRLGMVFGKGDPNQRFADTVKAMRLSDIIELPKDLASWRTCYSSVKNTARGIVLAAEKGKALEIYNIADGEIATELEWRQKIARILDWKGEFVITKEISAALNYNQDLLLDSSKIRTALGFKELCSADEQLREIV